MVIAMTTSPGVDQGWRPDDSTFGARLALVRQRMGWGNVAEAALACGVAIETWRTWERGRTPRNFVEVCVKISAVTGADVAWLAGLPRKDSNLQPAGNGTLAGIFD